MKSQEFYLCTHAQECLHMNASSEQIHPFTQNTAANTMQDTKVITLVALRKNCETKEHLCHVTVESQAIKINSNHHCKLLIARLIFNISRGASTQRPPSNQDKAVTRKITNQ